MLLDSLAERYGLLPSQVLAQATTLDLWVFDVAISYRNYRNERDAQGKKSLREEAPRLDYDPRELERKFKEFHERKSKSQ